jgi:hypothetical protein
MSDMAKQARAAMKAKASKLTSADPHQKVDSSTWTPPEALNADVKTGLRPISRRAFKKGGKVMGEKAKCDLGRKPRKSGGEATQYALAKVNRNVKDANEERSGIKHVGALKTGGRAKRRSGGPLSPEMQNAIEQIGRNPSPSPETMEISPQMQREMRAIMNRDSAASRDYEASEEAKRNYGITGQKRGGKVKKAGGGAMAGAQKMLQEAQQTAGVPSATLGFTGIKKGSLSPARGVGLKKGGTAKHDDVKQDMALIKKMVKPEARKGRDDGGRNYEDAPDYANRSFAFQKKSGPRQNQVSEFFKNKELPDVKNMSALERAGTVAKLAGKTLLEGPVRTGAYLMDEAGLKRGGKAKRTARKEGGGVFSGPGYPGKIPGVVPGGREARATGGKTKAKGKTNINIVIAAGKPAGAQDMMGMPPGMDGGPQGLPIPVPPPQGGMPMGGGAPMPMPAPPMPAPGSAPMPRKSGGRLMAKASSYKDMTAGSGGGEGRLQKTDIAKLHKDAPAFKKGGKVYRSYEDMDAGSGSGMGRLEKTEIQKRKS